MCRQLNSLRTKMLEERKEEATALSAAITAVSERCVSPIVGRALGS